MLEVGVYEAKARLAELLKRAAAGESIVITKRGKPIARLVGVEDEARSRAKAAAAEILALRKEIEPSSIDELLGARDEGRRF